MWATAIPKSSVTSTSRVMHLTSSRTPSACRCFSRASSAHSRSRSLANADCSAPPNSRRYSHAASTSPTRKPTDDATTASFLRRTLFRRRATPRRRVASFADHNATASCESMTEEAASAVAPSPSSPPSIFALNRSSIDAFAGTCEVNSVGARPPPSAPRVAAPSSADRASAVVIDAAPSEMLAEGTRGATRRRPPAAPRRWCGRCRRARGTCTATGRGAASRRPPGKKSLAPSLGSP